MTLMGFKKKLSPQDKALWIRRVDGVFSVYIRLRDMQAAKMDGYVKCISCPTIKFWKKMDCGHFQNRQFMYLRFNEQNCNAQCRKCNRFTEGNQANYKIGLIKKIGQAAVEQLEERKNWPAGFTVEGLKILYRDYDGKVKALKKALNIK